jgi:membrane protease YdiL (CAAX protease family)
MKNMHANLTFFYPLVAAIATVLLLFVVLKLLVITVSIYVIGCLLAALLAVAYTYSFRRCAWSNFSKRNCLQSISALLLGACACALPTVILVLGFSTTYSLLSDLLTIKLAALVLASPLIEEILFRGYLLVGLRRLNLNTTVVILVTAALFAFVHPAPRGAGVPFTGSAFLFGTLLAILAVRNSGIATSYAFHVGWNAIAAAIYLPRNRQIEIAEYTVSQNTVHLGLNSLILLMLIVWILRFDRNAGRNWWAKRVMSPPQQTVKNTP